MKTFYLFIVAAAFAFAAAPGAQAQTGTFCFSDNFGYQWEVVVNNNATDLIVGEASVGDFNGQLYASVGGRGQASSTIRHHNLTAINPDLADDPGDTDGNGNVDWFTYNGTVTGGSFPFTFSGDWTNSIGSTGTFSGPLVQGPCPFARQAEPVPGGPASAPATLTSDR
ncbi:MAG: hypothetical protein AAGI91_05185 [Bacteroidota bacterium]